MQTSLLAALGAASVLAATLLIAACIAIPTDFHTADSRENIEDFSLEDLVVGETTKEEVLMRLGEPDAVLYTPSVYEYRWEKVKGILAVGGGYSAAVGGWTKQSKLVVTFDDLGLISERRIVPDETESSF